MQRKKAIEILLYEIRYGLVDEPSPETYLTFEFRKNTGRIAYSIECHYNLHNRISLLLANSLV